MDNNEQPIPGFSSWASTKEASGENLPYLSVVVPAYNEYRRLPVTLMEMVDFLDLEVANNRIPSYEIIVVDDGSTDGTDAATRCFERIRSQIRLIKLATNCGKGYAVRTGVKNSRGMLIMFADADGATPFGELPRLLSAVKEDFDIAIGSRAVAATDTHVTTRWYRKLLGRVFNFAVNTILLPNVADTQCGFKLFKRPAAQFVFERQTKNRFSFDVEILYLARRAGFKVKEVPINWKNVPGSKVNLITDSLRMFIDLFIIRFRHSRIEKIK